MNIEIVIENRSNAIVGDNEISYNISFDKSCYVWYNGNGLRVHFIKKITRDNILAYHEEIKKELLRLDYIYYELPKLELCKLPTREVFDINNKILLESGDYFYRRGHIRFYQANENYRISIHYGNNKNIIIINDIHGNNSCYTINDKITITDQPFNAELFAESVKTYASDYLTILFSIFKPNNTKSAKLN